MPIECVGPGSSADQHGVGRFQMDASRRISNCSIEGRGTVSHGYSLPTHVNVERTRGFVLRPKGRGLFIRTTDLSKFDATAGSVRLANFIRANFDPIVHEWVEFAQTRTPASHSMTRLALQDHIVEILIFIADDLKSAHHAVQQGATLNERSLLFCNAMPTCSPFRLAPNNASDNAMSTTLR